VEALPTDFVLEVLPTDIAVEVFPIVSVLEALSVNVFSILFWAYVVIPFDATSKTLVPLWEITVSLRLSFSLIWDW
jgi:hypothetical protein